MTLEIMDKGEQRLCALMLFTNSGYIWNMVIETQKANKVICACALIMVVCLKFSNVSEQPSRILF